MGIDPSVLKLVESWQKSILADLAQHYPDQSPGQSKTIVFRLITVVLCLHLCESRGFINRGGLQALRENDNPYQGLFELWQMFYGCGSPFSSFDLSSLVILPNHLLREIIDSLYYPAPYQYAGLPIEILGQAYESLLDGFEINRSKKSATRSRKTGGVYYTPKPIVQYMIRNTIGKVGAPPKLHQVLDPACGGGMFLIEAYQYLLERQLEHHLNRDANVLQLDKMGRWQLPFDQRRQLLNTIHGVDVDVDAVAVTQLSLCLKLFENIGFQAGIDSTVLACINSNIQCGNALISLSDDQQTCDRSLDLESSSPFCWHTAFPEVFAAGGFDVVIGNPPYVDAETMTIHQPHWRSYCTTHYLSATGNWDLFCIFIEQALHLCRPGGLTSLIVPNKLLSADYASAARSLLSQTSHVLSIRDYSQVPVFAALVYPIVYLAQKVELGCSRSPENESPVLYEQMQSIDQVGQTHPLSLRSQSTKRPWLIGVSVQTDLIQRLEQLPKLVKIAQITGAATVAEAYLLKALIQNAPYPNSGHLRVINTGTLDRYCFLWGRKPMRYLGQSYLYPVISQADLSQVAVKRLSQAKQPKIIVAGMSQRLECGLDQTGYILAGKSTSIVQARQIEGDPVDQRYLLGILNSRLISFYFLSRFSGNRLQGGYVRVGPPQLRDLPIPSLKCAVESAKYQRVIELVSCLDMAFVSPIFQPSSDAGRQANQTNTLGTIEQARLKIEKLDAEIDAIVYELYQLSDKDVATIRECFK